MALQKKNENAGLEMLRTLLLLLRISAKASLEVARLEKVGESWGR